MITKVQLLFVRRPGTPLGQLEAHMASEGQRVRGAVPRGGRHRRLLRVLDDPTRSNAGGDSADASVVFDAVFEVAGEGVDLGALVAAVKAVGTRLEAWIAPDRSVALAGSEQIVVPGTERFVSRDALRRLPARSAEEFRAQWSAIDADVVRAIPGLRGYRQFLADPAESAAAAASAGLSVSDFDGIAEAYFDERAALLETIADSADPAHMASFVDQSRRVLAPYRSAWDAAV